jgi:hypothetical protein
VAFQLLVNHLNRQVIWVACAAHQYDARPLLDLFFVPGQCLANGTNPLSDVLAGKSGCRQQGHAGRRIRACWHPERDHEMVFQCLFKRPFELLPERRRVGGVIDVDRPEDVLSGQQGPDLIRLVRDDRQRGVFRVDHHGRSRRGHLVAAPETLARAALFQAVTEVPEEPGSGGGYHEPRSARDIWEAPNADIDRSPQVEQVNLGYLGGVYLNAPESLPHLKQFPPDVEEPRPDLGPFHRRQCIVDELQETPLAIRSENIRRLRHQEHHVPARTANVVPVAKYVRHPADQDIDARPTASRHERHTQQIFHQLALQAFWNT